MNVHAVLQLHGDACMKHKHYKSRGNNAGYAASELRIPLQIFMHDPVRDALHELIRSRVGKRAEPKACHNIKFNADKGETGYELLLPVPIDRCAQRRL